MARQTNDPLRDYVRGAKKLSGNEQFKQDMLDRIASHDAHTISGTKHIHHRPTGMIRRIAMIAAAFCCIIGISGFASHYLRENFDPHRPIDSNTDYSGTDSSHMDSSGTSHPDSSLYEPLLKQLQVVERQITALECQLTDAGTEDEIIAHNNNMQSLLSQREPILNELCAVMRYNADDMLLAYAGFDSAKQRLRLTVINGGSQERMIPSYCTVSNEEGMVASGYLLTENKWNLHTLPAGEWATLYCDLNYAALPDSDATSWKLAKGNYTLRLGDALFVPDTKLHTTLQIGRDAQLRAGMGSHLHEIAELMAEDYNDNLNHMDIGALAAQAQDYRYENDTSHASHCEQMMDDILSCNGIPDHETSGVDLSVYHLGESGNTAVIAKDLCTYYVYRDPETAQVYIGALTDIGSFGESGS